MDEQSELLKAVVENPDEDPPRLAYAAWCALQPEEELRAHGEFIRLEFEILAEPEAVRSTGGVYMRQLRLGELRDRWGAAWARPLAPYVEGFVFYRGFPALVTMTARNFLRHAADVYRLAPIRHLDLLDVLEVAGELFVSDHLSRLYSLSMNRCGLTAREMRLLADGGKLVELRWLSLEDNSLDFEASRILAGADSLRKLRIVRLNGNPVDPTEELGLDGGYVVDTSLPEAGVRLESEFGPIRWLHWTPDNGQFSQPI